jgi:hypothetical protein
MTRLPAYEATRKFVAPNKPTQSGRSVKAMPSVYGQSAHTPIPSSMKAFAQRST